MKNNEQFYCMSNTYRKIQIMWRLLICAILFFLASCKTLTYKPGELTGASFGTSGCAVIRYNGSFSKYGSRIDPSVTFESARGTFIASGTQVSIAKVESSWDFENGHRMRLYVCVPIKNHWRTFFLENTLSDEASRDSMNGFVSSMLLPCK